MGSFIVFMIMVALYFLPLIVAKRRRHRNGMAIGLLNLFGGVTLVGWVAALIWSCTDNVRPPQRRIPYGKNTGMYYLED